MVVTKVSPVEGARSIVRAIEDLESLHQDRATAR
jgi:hypothetical protein